MFAFGWAVIRQTHTVEDDNPGWVDRTDEIVESIRSFIGDDRLQRPYSAITLKWFGEYPLFQCLDRHHFRQTGKDLIAVFRYIAEVAPGSYGLLYMYDDDGDFGDDNNYSVLVLRRGEVAWQRDPFLSPLIPCVEDPLPGVESASHPYLPLGSVVTLRHGAKKLMVFDRQQRDTAHDRVFDYAGVPYPEGNIAPQATFLFDHEDIDEIHHLGFIDHDENVWVDKLNALPPVPDAV